MAVFQDSVLWHTGVIAIAGNAVTDDIQNTCQVLAPQAEGLKVKHGAALPSAESNNSYVTIASVNGRSPREISVKNLVEIIKARMEEILTAVQWEIEESGCKNMLGGVVLTGGGSKMKYLSQLADYVIGKESRLGAPTRYLSDDSPKELNDPIFSTAIGLVMFGLMHEAELAEEEALQQAEREARQAEMASEQAARQAAQAAEEAAVAARQPEEKPQENPAKAKHRLFDWTKKASSMLVNFMKDDDLDDDES